jgi:hypothetical protein
VQVTDRSETIKSLVGNLNGNDNGTANWECPEESLGAIMAVAPHTRNGDLLLVTDDVPFSPLSKGAQTLARLLLNRARLHSVIMPKTCESDESGFTTYRTLSFLTGGTYQKLASTDDTEDALRIVLSEMEASTQVYAATEGSSAAVAEPDPQGIFEHEVPVDDTLDTVNFLITELSDGSQTTVVYRPSGSPVLGSAPDVTYVDSGSAAYYTIANPAPGTWAVRSDGDFALRVTGDSELQFSYVGDVRAARGEWIELVARVAGEVSSSQFDLVTPGGRYAQHVELRDDGLGGDLQQGDGLYTGYFNPESAEDYRLKFSGETQGGTEFVRTDARLIRVHNVSVSAPEPETVSPGAYHTFRFEVANLGSSAETYDLVATSGFNWIRDTPPASIWLDGGETTTVQVTVQVPPDAYSNQIDNISLSAVLRDDPSVIAEGTTAVIVPDVDEVHVAVRHVYLPLVLRNRSWSLPPTNHPPNTPSSPSPSDSAPDQSVDVALSWTGGDPDGDSVTYDVYLEAYDSTPDTLICNDAASAYCDPGTLNHDMHYYWKIVARDEHGATASGPVWEFTTSDSPAWIVECVDWAKDFSGMTDRSLQLDADDHPHIAYGADHLYYARHDGGTWHREIVDDSPGVGQYAALALDGSSYPHISYYDAGNEDLKYAYRDWSGWHIHTVDSAGGVGSHTSLALDGSSYPHISYYDAGNEDLKYAYRDWSGWQIDTVDSAGRVGSQTSLALDGSGYPHISYTDTSNFDLKYASRDGTGWHIDTVSALPSDGSTSLALDEADRPHIGYWYQLAGTWQGWVYLKYAHRNGDGWHIETVPDGEAGWTSLVLDRHGFPHISCRARSNVKYAYQNEAGWRVESVSNGGSGVHSTSLALDEHGYPHISYEGAGTLQYAHYGTSANHPPNMLSSPSPPEHAVEQSVDVSLSWVGGDPDGDSVTYEVYLEAGDTCPDVLLCDETASTTCDPGTLSYDTRYWWRVIARDEHGATTAGPIWSFTTEGNPGPGIWQPVASPVESFLSGVSMISADDGWAVGDAGTIIHWDGASWQVASSPTTSNLEAVHMLSPNDGWAVGWDGTIVRWNGSSWQSVTSPTSLTLRSVFMVSTSDGWIVGGDTPDSVILHWNGVVWSTVPLPAIAPAILIDVAMVSATDGWAVGNYGRILRWNGSSWQLVDSPTSLYIISVDMVSATDGWAVGGLYPDGEIYRWNGTSWQTLSSPPSNELEEVSMVSSTDGWAVSWYGDELLHWDGVSWTKSSSQIKARAVDMLSSTDAWAVGVGIMHYAPSSAGEFQIGSD